jgi:hypothetical protein
MANNNKNNQQLNQGEDSRENKGSESKEKAPKKNLTRVRFNQAHTPYLKGEVAGLEPERAKKLIDAKICSKV